MLEFRILGPVELWSDNSELPLNGKKQRTMLAALLLADEQVLPDYRLGEVLWGKNPPDTYQAQIYTYASRLRHHLDGQAEIVRKGAGYLLRAVSGRFDYREFQALCAASRTALRERNFREATRVLQEALALWRGPTLTDVTEQLMETAGPGIEEARMEALENRISADLALGGHEELTPELVALVGTHPLRERLRAQLMVALYMSNRQADAFAAYHAGQRHLQEELGVDPGPALRHAYQAILTGEPEAVWHEPADLPAHPRGYGTPLSVRRGPTAVPDQLTIPGRLVVRAPRQESRLGAGTRFGKARRCYP
ncbi:AfsR/SARP family transcriptional regulator [Streptomyces sp. DH8]|uniref:AfsR/SARP family transcriptional regulator n=1 Tax=Streptomyces sp. DH8 TaxID=2857008 RepID=UPI001E59BD14|nr:AfsR/SARP family transcriptional regulator [Streptomyces sp. DH8]